MWAALLAQAAVRQGRPCPEYFSVWPLSIPAAPWGAMVTTFYAQVRTALLMWPEGPGMAAGMKAGKGATMAVSAFPHWCACDCSWFLKGVLQWYWCMPYIETWPPFSMRCSCPAVNRPLICWQQQITPEVVQHILDGCSMRCTLVCRHSTLHMLTSALADVILTAVCHASCSVVPKGESAHEAPNLVLTPLGGTRPC